MTATAPKPKERITLIALLDWAFQKQRAHRTDDSDGFGLRLGSPRDSCVKLEEIGALMGCRIDGGQWKEIGHRVHPDASTVVEAVRRLPTAWSALVWQHACAGTVPDWGEVVRVWPHRRENGKVAVERHDVTITDRRGRTSTVTASYCKFEIFPNIEFCREEWGLWYRGIALLEMTLPGLIRWDVTGIGVEAEPWNG